MNTVIRRNWLYNQIAQEIWEFLTKSELIEKWLMPNDFKLEIGNEFKFTTNPIPQLGLDGNFYCKVLEIVSSKKLVYSWKGGLERNNPTLDTIVEWTLEPVESGTELRLIHSGFNDENSSIFSAMFEGWNEHIQKMIMNLKSTQDVSIKS